MAKDTFDKILSSTPLNSTAGRVTSKGTHYTPEIEFGTHKHFDAPPPMKRVPSDAEDLTGRKFGRLTVVGLGDTKRGNGSVGGSWVVRCACGDYEHRRRKAILNPENTGDKCRVCYDFEVKRKRYDREGSRPIEDFIKQPSNE